MTDGATSYFESSYEGIGDLQTTEPFSDFNPWFASLIDEIQPSLIVGIARGAIRLLQLQNAEQVCPGIPIVSDNALPFITESNIRDKRVLLFDDSVIFGSTLSAIRDYLLKRGAIVFCAAYIIDRFSFLGEPDPEEKSYPPPSKFRHIPIRAKHQMWPSAIRRHHNILVDSLLRTPRDYNIDFPAFNLKISNYCSSDIPYILNLLHVASVVKKCFDVSSTIASGNKIYRYSVLLEPIFSKLFTKGRLFCRPYSKARLTFVPELQEIRITPMPQLSMADGLTFEEIRFTDRGLGRLWRRLSPPEDKNDAFYNQAIFRLSTVFTAIVLGETLVQHFTAALDSEFQIEEAQLVDEDLGTIVGDRNSFSLQQMWTYFRKREAIPNFEMNHVDPLFDFSEYLNEELMEAISTAWHLQPWLKPQEGELAYEVLGKVFLTLRAVTDSKECRTLNPLASRLDVGLSYEGIRHLVVNECGINLTPDDISLTIDMCVDNGQAVPKVIQQESVWLRAFYSGEAEDSHKIFQLKDAIHKGYSEFLEQKGVNPLTQFDMHKLCSTLKELFPWLPISTKFYTFGRFARVGKSDTEIIAWLVNRGDGPLNLFHENGRRVLRINKNYQPCVKPTWGLRDRRDFFDAFQYVATAFSRSKDDEAKLLLSTCRTHRHTYNAVAFEAHSWTRHERGDFGTIISNIDLSSDNALQYIEELTSSIYWCSRFISEALKKHEIFHKKFDTLKDRVEQAFVSQGPPSARFWEFNIEARKMLDSSEDPEIALRFSYLMPLVHQMMRLTAFVTRILIDFGMLSRAELQEKFLTEGTSLASKEFKWLTNKDPRVIASNYNIEIRQKRIAGLSIEKTLLPLDIPSSNNDSGLEWYRKAIRAVKECFDEVVTSLNKFCPEYDVTEGDFPYSPDTSKRTLPDGRTESRLDDFYVLTMDIIGSTDSEQTIELKDYILQIFRDFKHKGVYFENTGNDAYVACCVDPIVLWDIAKLVMVHGQMLRGKGGRFGGTRKGLSFGSVNIVQDADGNAIIRDGRSPNLLPRAFYLLEGVDRFCKAQPDLMNPLIIVEATATKHLDALLNLEMESRKPISVKSKHFNGQGYCFELSSYSRSN